MHTFTLPSGPETGLVEMTGVEEDLLTNQRLIKTGAGAAQDSDSTSPGLRSELCSKGIA